jgi:hypothetical protein
MAAPKVQKLADIMAGLDPAFAGTKAIYNQQLSAVPAKFDAQKQALEVTKGNQFRQINRSANAKGLAFSGMPTEEQTRYLGEQYLPALAGYDTQANTEQLQIRQLLAQLAQDQTLKATDIRGHQQDTLDSYLEAERQRQAAAQEAAKQRAFDAQQNALQRRASASKSAADGVDISLHKNKRGGWDVYENGKPSKQYDLASASRLLGKDLVSLLANGDKQDRQAAKFYRDNINLGRGEAYAKSRLLRDRGTAFYLGGYY